MASQHQPQPGDPGVPPGCLRSPAARPWIDLSHPLQTGMPIYPGDPPVRVQPCRTHTTDGYQVSGLDLGTHSGTHVDAPLHFFPGGRSIDQVPAGQFIGRGVVIDASAHPPGGCIGPAVIAPWQDTLRRCDFALLYTGWDRFFDQPAYLDHPHLSPELAAALAGCGVGLVGVDCASPDPTLGEAFPAHDTLLGAGVLIVENLTNLSSLAGQVGEFILLPLKVAGGDGAPIRALGRALRGALGGAL